MNNHFDEQWSNLQKIRPTKNQKDEMKTRIRQSIQDHPTNIKKNNMIQWKSILAACTLFLICGSFLWLLLQDQTQLQNAKQPTIDEVNFSWELKDVYPEKSGNGFALFRKGQLLQVGAVNEVTEAEMNEIVNSAAMFVNEKLEHFPYPTTMYIEHIKRENVALRYHFFIKIDDEKWTHFSFDYDQIEFAEIFQAMATLELQGKRPYHHNEQLYVKHGYGNMIYPVGLKPVPSSPNKEKYYWSISSFKPYYNYLEKIEETGVWKKKSANGNIHVFVSVDGNEEITINFDGKDITYEFVYLNQEE